MKVTQDKEFLYESDSSDQSDDKVVNVFLMLMEDDDSDDKV